jgi:hypothetical protein
MAVTSFVNSMLDSAFSGGTLTLHLYRTGTPSTTGVEVSGGTYAAQTVTMSSAASKIKSLTSNASFTGLPSQTVVAWGLKKAGTLIDEGTFATSFTPDVTNNTLTVSYSFNAAGL